MKLAQKTKTQDSGIFENTNLFSETPILTVPIWCGPGIVIKIGPSPVLKAGPSFAFFPIFIVFFGACLKNTNTVTLCQNSVLQNFGDVKNEVFEKNIAFFVFFLFYVGEMKTEKRKEM